MLLCFCGIPQVFQFFGVSYKRELADIRQLVITNYYIIGQIAHAYFFKATGKMGIGVFAIIYSKIYLETRRRCHVWRVDSMHTCHLSFGGVICVAILCAYIKHCTAYAQNGN